MSNVRTVVPFGDISIITERTCDTKMKKFALYINRCTANLIIKNGCYIIIET